MLATGSEKFQAYQSGIALNVISYRILNNGT